MNTVELRTTASESTYRSRAGRSRQGTATVEFAIVAPLLVFLMLGMVEYGRLVMVQQMLTNAAREGARVAIIDGASMSQVQSAVETYLAQHSLSNAVVGTEP